MKFENKGGEWVRIRGYAGHSSILFGTNNTTVIQFELWSYKIHMGSRIIYILWNEISRLVRGIKFFAGPIPNISYIKFSCMKRSYGTIKQQTLGATHEMSLRDMKCKGELCFIHSPSRHNIARKKLDFASMSRRDISWVALSRYRINVP